MRKLIITIFVLMYTGTVWAQNNALEAKAAYLLAEEEFNNGKYETAIKYLDEAIVKLGTANAKILYMKILSLQALVEKEEKLTPRLQEVISAFEKAPDVADFNEEKQLEVMKLKLKLKAYAPPSKFEVLLDSLLHLNGLRIGMPADKLLITNPLYKAQIDPVITSGNGKLQFYPFVNGQFIYTILSVDVIKGTVSEFTSDIPALNYLNKQDTSSSKGDLLLSQFLSKIEAEPEVTEKTDAWTNNSLKTDVVQTVRTYTWLHNKMKIVLTHTTSRLMKKRPAGVDCLSSASIKVIRL